MQQWLKNLQNLTRTWEMATRLWRQLTRAYSPPANTADPSSWQRSETTVHLFKGLFLVTVPAMYLGAAFSPPGEGPPFSGTGLPTLCAMMAGIYAGHLVLLYPYYRRFPDDSPSRWAFTRLSYLSGLYLMSFVGVFHWVIYRSLPIPALIGVTSWMWIWAAPSRR